MKTRLALLALCAMLLAAVPALGEPGDKPMSPESYMPADQFAQMEHKRQVDAVGGITASPYWLKQGYLCGRSISLRLYEVDKPVLPKQMLFKEYLRYAEDGSGEKELLLTLIRDVERVEIRIGSDALAMLDRAGVARVIIRNHSKDVMQVYEREEMRAASAYFSLGEKETICLQGEDGPMFAYDEDSVRRRLAN